MKKHALFRSLAACATAAWLLAGCGGGGGDGGGSSTLGPPPSARFGASTQFEGICDLPTQKRFVRSYLDEVYLWYNEVPEVNAAAYSNIPDYFNALLVRTPDANGQPKDRFSAVLPASQASDVLAQAALQFDATQLLSAGTGTFVPLVFTDSTGSGRRFGYIQFTDHDVGAQDQLIAAFQQVRDAGAQDLVLDLRRNSGGFLYIALTAASMVTGPGSSGQVFERLRYNDKRTAESNASTLFFSSTVQFAETQHPVGSPLPQLGLPRVFVLTTGQTCSASESIINALQGIGVQVVRIGTTTCGKPYGFRQKNNCGWAFFPIEFQGTNAKGFGDYTTGFRPTCEVQDNATAGAGSASDPLLTAAKFYIDNGQCPAGTATGGLQSAATPITTQESPRRPAWAGRLLRPDQR
ncbi:hypothetical protein H8N03_17590 [Ramlibacter sp. USB13]|uniref:Peptidase S41 n=1 Tax=Ramlibacter cellulosilyticus TaxID=2764187 RepID=A0A923SGB5_9BURK|nr:S41 family peptidase [Ramlibacter cellulosilyticus]MBC5784767.1 hypothetical protein [Ramlibacter cellulosilyticus]